MAKEGSIRMGDRVQYNQDAVKVFQASLKDRLTVKEIRWVNGCELAYFKSGGCCHVAYIEKSAEKQPKETISAPLPAGVGKGEGKKDLTD